MFDAELFFLINGTVHFDTMNLKYSTIAMFFWNQRLLSFKRSLKARSIFQPNEMCFENRMYFEYLHQYGFLSIFI